MPPISPAEILQVILNAEIDTAICPSGAVVGPATNTQQREGVAQLTDAGSTKIEKYLPLMWSRAQVRVLHEQLSEADRIAYHIWDLLQERPRQVVATPSSGQKWVVHSINMSASPSQHWDSAATWEELFFVEVAISACPAP
jgi:hypothetical protein